MSFIIASLIAVSARADDTLARARQFNQMLRNNADAVLICASSGLVSDAAGQVNAIIAALNTRVSVSAPAMDAYYGHTVCVTVTKLN